MAKEIVKFNDKEFQLYKNRILDRGKIYRNLEGTLYLRIGPEEMIKEESSFVRRLHELGFPVPEVQDEGIYKGLGFYIESSVGNVSLGELFQEEYKRTGEVHSRNFNTYCEMMSRFLSIQLESIEDVNGSG